MRNLIVFILFMFVIIGCSSNENSNPVISESLKSHTTIFYDGSFYSKDSLKIWGFGNEEYDYSSSERNYDWYYDQYSTGEYSYMNCGPTCVQMAAKWQNENSTCTAEKLRNSNLNNGNGYYYFQMKEFLTNYGVKYTQVSLNYHVEMLDTIQKVIERGSIIIAGIMTGFLTWNKDKKQKIGLFYSGNGPHFIIIKGIRKVDNDVLLEIYDPIGSAKYFNSQPMGRNRHVKGYELYKAISSYENGKILVIKK